MTAGVLELQLLTETERPITYGVVKPGVEDPEKGVLFVRGGDIADGIIDISVLRTITQEVSAPYARTILRGGEVVISLVGNPGAVAVVPDTLAGANLARQVGLIALKPEYHAPYIKYYLMSPQGKAELFQRTQGAVQQVINLADLKKIKVRVLPKPEQERIAGVLSAFDDLIENNRRRIALLEQSARLLYREWFVHLRFPGHEHVKVVDGVPEGWERLPFSALADYVNGYPFKPAELFSEGLPIIKIPELRDGATDKTPRNPGEDIPEKYFVNDKDLLFSWSGTLLVNFWHQGSALLNQHLFRVDPLRGCGKEFLFFAIDCAMPAFTNQTTGATMKHIRKSALDSVTTLCPNGVLMKEFQDCVEPTFDLIHKLNQTNGRLRAARDLLLPRLMSGDLVV